MDSSREGIYVSTSNRILVFISIFVLMFVVTSLISSIIMDSNIEERTGLLLTSCIQNILVFMLPSYIIAKIEYKSAFNSLGLCSPISMKNIIGVIIVMVIAVPMMNQIIYWNQNVGFPESLRGIETTLREWEKRNSDLTEMLLSGNNFATFISSIFVIGVITPIGEELFFRAGLQRILGSIMSRNFAIWLAAAIFSAMHFQFFGFIPRLLLGAFFGYLYVWTGSIWAPIIAHAFNNSTVVILSYLSYKGIIGFNFDEFGVMHYGFLWEAFTSLILVITFFIYLKKRFFYGTKNI